MASLYLHIPFCSRKCPYCDFYSVENHAAQLQLYPTLLIRHLQWAAGHGWPRAVDSVYFGGGTPSLIPAADIAGILETIARCFDVTDQAEITLEANPGTVTRESLRGYREAGVNRLSLGLQSTSDRLLARLGRLHDGRQGLGAYRLARQAGFDNISLDLMFGLPGQSPGALEQDLQTFIDLAPEHLSCYGLTAEAGTLLHADIARGALALPDEDAYAEGYLRIHDRLSAAGYAHYEIANFARTGFASRHNLGYWQRRPCLGLGAGAHTFVASGWGERRAVPNDLEVFRDALRAEQDPSACVETFDRQGAMRETLYLGLRTHQGVAESRFRHAFGIGVAEAFPGAIAQLSSRLTKQNGCWRLRPTDWLLYDHLIQAFL